LCIGEITWNSILLKPMVLFLKTSLAQRVVQCRQPIRRCWIVTQPPSKAHGSRLELQMNGTGRRVISLTDDGVPITLQGLTKRQLEMLAKVWSMETREELEHYREGLPKLRQRELDTLIMMLIMEIEGERADEDTTQAANMLRDIGVNV
jgi:hypothetical protein